MFRFVGIVAAVSIGLSIAAEDTQAQAGGCICWSDDGSASECHTVSDPSGCAAACGGYDNIYFAEGDGACEGPDGSGLVIRSPDTDDIDGDGDTNEIVRWRYVVSVTCAIQDGMCVEIYTLVRCWKDDAHD